jgi:exonuclease VII small subunit
MAQPLAHSDTSTTSGIDEAGFRLEQALERLAAAARQTTHSQHSLTADNEKLNGLLQEAGEEIARLRNLAETVSTRLDSTIAVLERGATPLHS